MSKRIVPFLFLFFFFVLALQAQQKIEHKRLGRVVDSILQRAVDSNLIPGAVIEIKNGNKVICRKAFGFAERNDDNNQQLARPVEMTTGCLFDIASLTKVVGTTTAIMLLVDRGLIRVDDPVGKYIAAFNTSDKKEIRIRQLLTHTAGLITWYPLFYRANNKQVHQHDTLQHRHL